MHHLVIVVCAVILAVPALAQEPVEPPVAAPPETVGEGAAAALARIDRATAAFDRYEGMLAAASGEDRQRGNRQDQRGPGKARGRRNQALSQPDAGRRCRSTDRRKASAGRQPKHCVLR